MSTRPAVDGDLAPLLGRLEERAASWFPDLGPGPVAVTVVRADRRPASRTLVVRLAPPSPAGARTVFVKVPHPRVELVAVPGGGAEPRPRVAPILDIDVRRHEAAATRRAQRVFDDLGDPDLAVVRVLDDGADLGATVFAFEPQPTAHHLLVRRAAWRLPCPDLEAGLRNAGRWLRHHHRTPPGPGAVRRAARPADWTEVATRLADHLAASGAGGPRLRRTVAEACALAADVLPDPLPLVHAHGDFGVANVFVAPGGAVTVCDILGVWEAPAWEDVAYLLTSIKASQTVLLGSWLTLGPDGLRRLEAAFLGGYGGAEPVPLAAVRLFELLAVLDKWTSVSCRLATGPRGPMAALTGRGLDRALDQLVDRLAGEARRAAG